MTNDQARVTPPPFEKGGYVARFAVSDEDLKAAQSLRHLCFVERAGRAPLPDLRDSDRFDALCDHVLIEADGALVCCFRVMPFASGAQIEASYSAQFYDLASLTTRDFAMIELGRFCVRPDVQDAAVLRVAWGMLAAYVDVHEAGLLFGCSSFEGTSAAPYKGAFDLLATHYGAPDDWPIKVKTRDVVAYKRAATAVTDHKAALQQVPPLLRSYLSMGGWVSDHAVIDEDMNTLHVFTGLEIDKIPAARAKALRAVSQ